MSGLTPPHSLLAAHAVAKGNSCSEDLTQQCVSDEIEGARVLYVFHDKLHVKFCTYWNQVLQNLVHEASTELLVDFNHLHVHFRLCCVSKLCSGHVRQHSLWEKSAPMFRVFRSWALQDGSVPRRTSTSTQPQSQHTTRGPTNTKSRTAKLTTMATCSSPWHEDVMVGITRSRVFNV